ncbi:hypothetical protein Sjap_020602 [Stephania japonica]|uniref:Cytochrome P450 n=1 Tax=Stephania japonica TaxID=461633 RepID=A0AAP0HVQ3_9MAGN
MVVDIVVASLYALIFILILISINLFRRSPHKNLPPGPCLWPLLGNLPAIFTAKTPPHVTLSNLARTHGGLMLLWFGHKPVVFVSNKAAATEVLKTHDKALSCRYIPASFHFPEKPQTFLVWSDCDAYWKQVWRVLRTEVFSPTMLRVQEGAREEKLPRPFFSTILSLLPRHPVPSSPPSSPLVAAPSSSSSSPLLRCLPLCSAINHHFAIVASVHSAIIASTRHRRLCSAIIVSAPIGSSFASALALSPLLRNAPPLTVPLHWREFHSYAGLTSSWLVRFLKRDVLGDLELVNSLSKVIKAAAVLELLQLDLSYYDTLEPHIRCLCVVKIIKMTDRRSESGSGRGPPSGIGQGSRVQTSIGRGLGRGRVQNLQHRPSQEDHIPPAPPERGLALSRPPPPLVIRRPAIQQAPFAPPSRPASRPRLTEGTLDLRRDAMSPPH